MGTGEGGKEKARAVQDSWPESMSAKLSLLGKPRNSFGILRKKLLSIYHMPGVSHTSSVFFIKANP